MIQQGEQLKMTVNLDASYVDGDGMVSNTIAEIPGTDPKLKDQIVMLRRAYGFVAGGNRCDRQWCRRRRLRWRRPGY
jgi:hypothetical protein